jgi:hypothetical protein
VSHGKPRIEWPRDTESRKPRTGGKRPATGPNKAKGRDAKGRAVKGNGLARGRGWKHSHRAETAAVATAAAATPAAAAMTVKSFESGVAAIKAELQYDNADIDEEVRLGHLFFRLTHIAMAEAMKVPRGSAEFFRWTNEARTNALVRLRAGVCYPYAANEYASSAYVNGAPTLQPIRLEDYLEAEGAEQPTSAELDAVEAELASAVGAQRRPFARERQRGTRPVGQTSTRQSAPSARNRVTYDR